MGSITTLKFKVSVTEQPSMNPATFIDELNKKDKLLGVLSFYCVPRKGEHLVHDHGNGELRGYTVENVYHYTEETNPDDGTVGMIQVMAAHLLATNAVR